MGAVGRHTLGSGLTDAWIESGIYSDVTVESIIKGTHYNRGVRAHKVTYEALWTILLVIFET